MTTNHEAAIYLALDALQFADRISPEWDAERQLKHLREQIGMARKHLEGPSAEQLKEIQAKAVMEFAGVPVGAFEANFIETPHLTIAELYQYARHHVRDHYGYEAKSLADEMGEDFARECMGKEDGQ
ncbi:hypothetical protein [Marinobacterium lutimaris]|uniref:Uncharacterized protein n=1 Tax=Marinobacterium lutimaris TaxID=568106 RepID=A0A1H5YCX9_9GAMM|nr:hypothetical protein [Marinobacterium lutimaris]SEG21622.1 hypothetical protein SAMN05444390_1011701 [Marinobacterium lutimaris]